MIDRYVGIAGLVIGILAFIAPYRWPDMPLVITTAGLYFAILLIGAASGMFFTGKYSNKTPSSNSVALFLQFSDSHSVPREIRQTNVRSWYALYTESIYVDALDKDKKPVGGFSVPPRWTIFLLFEVPANFRQMVTTCSGTEGFKCAVQYSTDRYAIITVIGDTTKATLNISTIL